ncbi:hypothetical protein ACIHCM_14270 [Streptomyces sp. NPDC052023]|uniref:hypothetical protein n=1 Tax=Streptomyces sp. NPDC052023 TaxID=3365681 RepID=UPI0037D47480
MNDYRPVDRDLAPEHYGRLRVQTADLTPAGWLTGRTAGFGEAGGLGTVSGVTGPGFPGYVRVLHPASLDERPVRWATAAAAYGRTVTPTARWHELVGMDGMYHNASEYGLPGVWDEHPAEGPTPPPVAEALIPVLARHTRTPEHCWFGLWNGYGRWDFDRFPVFGTPGRDEVLLSGTLADAVSPTTLDEFAELPDLWWPRDRAWCVGGDVDLVSTYVGGSPELIAELLADPGLETHPVAAGDPVG